MPVVYDGKIGTLTRIALKNMVLNLATLGLYRFWAKTRVRLHFWEHFTFAGNRFEYLGNGKELFLGFLIVLLVIIPLAAVDTAVNLFLKPSASVYGSLYDIPKSMFILFLIGLATYRARGYRLSRTAWRGIRGSQTGKARTYALKFLGYLLLAGITLGLALPLMNMRLERYRINNTFIGDRAFSFEGKAKDLFWWWLLYWVLLVPTLGAAYLWYRAREVRYVAANTGFGGVRFQSSIRGRHLFLPYLIYCIAIGLLFFALSLIAGPFMLQLGQKTQNGQMDMETIAILVAAAIIITAVLSVVRLIVLDQPVLRATFGRLSASGPIDFTTIKQSKAPLPGRGEGLASAFDLGDF